MVLGNPAHIAQLQEGLEGCAWCLGIFGAELIAKPIALVPLASTTTVSSLPDDDPAGAPYQTGNYGQPYTMN